MVRIVESTILDAPVEAVWAVLRDFNGHDQWHPAVADSLIERSSPSDRVGCVRRFHLADGSELREQLLTLSDADMAFSYCLLDTPPGRETELRDMVAENIYRAGFAAVREHMGLPVPQQEGAR